MESYSLQYTSTFVKFDTRLSFLWQSPFLFTKQKEAARRNIRPQLRSALRDPSPTQSSQIPPILRDRMSIESKTTALHVVTPLIHSSILSNYSNAQILSPSQCCHESRSHFATSSVKYTSNSNLFSHLDRSRLVE